MQMQYTKITRQYIYNTLTVQDKPIHYITIYYTYNYNSTYIHYNTNYTYNYNYMYAYNYNYTLQ